MEKLIDSFLRFISLVFSSNEKSDQTFVRSLSNENLVVLAEAVQNEVIVRKQQGEMPSNLIPFIEDML